MTAQKGKDLLVKVDMNNSGLFQALAGLRASRLTLNSEAIDITNMDSVGGWRELLVGGGVRSASISGSGVFRDQASDERARAIFFGGEMPRFQIVVPDFGIMEGAFQINAIEYAGNHDGEAVYEIALTSGGPVDFTAI